LIRALLLAKRDYLQMVQSKAYLFALILFPLLFAGGFLAIPLANRGNSKDLRMAVLDRTGVSAAAVMEASGRAYKRAVANVPFSSGSAPRLMLEEVKPEADSAAQYLALSDRIRSGELFLVLEISPQALDPGKAPAGGSKQAPVRYYTNSGGLVDQVALWLPGAVNDALRRVRLAQLGVDPARVGSVLGEVRVESMNLATRDPITGKIGVGSKKNAVQAGVVPFFLVFLLMMISIFGSAPNLGVIAEDKMQRVFEMLLSSASPFELMMGKVLASLGASLTSSAIYILAGLAALAGMAMFGIAPLHLLPWFFVYVIASVLMLSGLSVALGSACATPQDAQHFAFVLILPVMIPIFLLTPLMQQPNGALATGLSFFPPFTPVLMLLRQSMPGGVPAWQPWVGLGGVCVWAAAMIWFASRIFRIGILSQGKTPQLGELARWAFRH